MKRQERKQLHDLLDHAINHNMIINLYIISHESTAYTASTLTKLPRFKVNDHTTKSFPFSATGRIGRVEVNITQHRSATEDFTAIREEEAGHTYDHEDNYFRQSRPPKPSGSLYQQLTNYRPGS